MTRCRFTPNGKELCQFDRMALGNIRNTLCLLHYNCPVILSNITVKISGFSNKK